MNALTRILEMPNLRAMSKPENELKPALESRRSDKTKRQQDRKDRLAAELRRNLARRKAQSRARQDEGEK